MVVWVTPDLVVRPILNSQCQASRLILSRENSTPRYVMFDPRLPIRWRIRLAGCRNTRCSKTNSSAHNGKGDGLPCRFPKPCHFGGCNSPLLTHPEAVMDLSGSRASHLSQGSVRAPLPPEGGARTRVAPHRGHVGRWFCPTPPMCRRIHGPVHSKYKPWRRIKPLTCMSAMEGASSRRQICKNGPPGLVREASFVIRRKANRSPT
jgi:hypothetical protein